ncbi:MAG: TonB-dependent siderophore receptor [Burkholderiaceae bacterium]|nr:TonB-dependent siderophore receptor [Burkholderiaceae bacterium]
MKNFQLKTIAGILAGGLFSSYVQADNQLPEIQVKVKAEKTDQYDVTEASSATKQKIALRNIPQIVNVVPDIVMREQNASSVQDALQNVVGLSFSVGDGQRDQVAIRGFTAIYDQYIDGIRDDAMYFRDLSNIERIEVLKGPASVLYGRGSAGGLINRITKKPQAHPESEVALSLSSQGQKRTSFDVGGASEQLNFRINGALEDSSNFRDQFSLKRQAVAPSVTWQLSPATRITAQADYLKDKRIADQGLPAYRGRPVDVPVNTFYGAANASDVGYVQSDVVSGTITLDHTINESLSLHSAIRSYDFKLDRNYTGIGDIKDGATPTVSIGQSKRLRNENGTYWQTELSQKAQWGDTRHQLMYGVELGTQDKEEILWSRNNVATYNLFQPVRVNLAAMPTTLVPGTNTLNRYEFAAAYVQDLISLTPQWKILAGLRYDSLRQNRDDRTSKNLDQSRQDNNFAPRLGFVYHASDALSFYASNSTSFQPLADTFTIRTNTDKLEPTKTTNNEIGLKLDIDAKASLTLAVFDMRQNNVQVQDPLNKNASLPVGKQGTKGVELQYTGEIAKGWDILAGYAYMRGEILESTELTSAGTPFKGNASALTPKHSANLWLKYTINPAWYVAGGGRAESARYASPDNLVTLPGYTVINLATGYQTGKLEFNVSLRNLFNRRYFVAAHSGANDYNMPGESRGLYMTTRYRF